MGLDRKIPWSEDAESPLGPASGWEPGRTLARGWKGSPRHASCPLQASTLRILWVSLQLFPWDLKSQCHVGVSGRAVLA